jgi:hypothetical protein
LEKSVVPRLPKLAPASVDAKSSFSIYQSILADDRQSLKIENMAMLVIFKFNTAGGRLLMIGLNDCIFVYTAIEPFRTSAVKPQLNCNAMFAYVMACIITAFIADFLYVINMHLIIRGTA